MAYSAVELYNLLPAIDRLRDAERGYPLRDLVTVLAEQAQVVAENLDQMYDDLFIETCAAWVVPYIGDLIGNRALHGVVPAVSSPRAEVANTIAFRRRKGTASMLEQLARDVTDWDARVVEFFQTLATTQYLNHLRPHNRYSPDLRRGATLAAIDTPFDTVAHTLEVRRIAPGRGVHNIPNVGIFLWRIQAYALQDSPAARLDARRYRFDPLGRDTLLFNDPVPETTITHLAERANVPMPLGRRELHDHLAQFYGADASLQVKAADGTPVPRDRVHVCDLSDTTGGDWANLPAATAAGDPPLVAVDPVLGRLAFSADVETPLVSFHYGFSAPLGGGAYERAATFDEEALPVQHVAAGASVQDAVTLVADGGAVEIDDCGRYSEALSVTVGDGARIELRAANGMRPTVLPTGDLTISGSATGEVTLNGLLIDGVLRVTGDLRRLRLRHCTLAPRAAGLLVDAANVQVEIDHCILGGLRVVDGASVTLRNSLVDAGAEDAIAYAGPDETSAGGKLVVETCTVVGKVWTRLLTLASNSIFLARLAPGDPWRYPVMAARRQEGCVRFSFVPLDAQTPARHRCRPAPDDDPLQVRPQFTSLRWGDPGYGQLSLRCADAIRRGADDEAEMGVFHDLFQPQRETNLRVRLDEYLRFGLEAGIFYVT